MDKKNKIELFYTLTCPNCKTMKRLLKEALKTFDEQFELKQTNASLPFGMLKTIKLGIHSVPTLTINNEIVFRNVPTKKELLAELNKYINK